VPLLIGIIALLVIGGSVYVYQNKKTEIPPVVDNALQQSNQTQQTPQTDTSFKVISPKAGDSLIIGGTYTVKFQNLPKGSFVQGWLQNKNEVNAGTASIGVVESGRDGNPSSNIQIKIPSQWCGGDCGAVQYVAPGQYRLQLRIYPSAQNPSYQTFYSDYFSITGPKISQPSITVLSPNGGETYKIGDTVKISWSGNNLGVSNINISWCKSNSGCNNIVTRIPNSGNYSWTIPATFAPGSYKIQIGNDDIDNAVSDESDNYFTITSPTQQTEKVQVYVNVVDKDGRPFKPDKVEWYYPPVNGQATQYPAKCTNEACIRWSVTGATASKIYVVANYKKPSSPEALCFSQAYDAKPVELSSTPAEITLTMGLESYCY
jgi:hypothetical protein